MSRRIGSLRKDKLQELSKIADGFISQTFPLDLFFVQSYIAPLASRDRVGYMRVFRDISSIDKGTQDNWNREIDILSVWEEITDQLYALDLLLVEEGVWQYVPAIEVLHGHIYLRWDNVIHNRIKIAKRDLDWIIAQDIPYLYKLSMMHDVVASVYSDKIGSHTIFEYIGLQLRKMTLLVEKKYPYVIHE